MNPAVPLILLAILLMILAMTCAFAGVDLLTWYPEHPVLPTLWMYLKTMTVLMLMALVIAGLFGLMAVAMA